MDRAQLVEQLVRHEGLRLRPYKDTVGKLTIGVGRNLDDVGISRDEAFEMLDRDINKVVIELDKNLSWWIRLRPAHQVVLANMCFNMGIGRLMKFKKFLSALQSGNFQRARQEMLDSLWADQVHGRAAELADLIWQG